MIGNVPASTILVIIVVVSLVGAGIVTWLTRKKPKKQD